MSTGSRTWRNRVSRAGSPRAGFSLVEILIAMFVFLVGVLGVLAAFPVAMDAAGRSIKSTRGDVVAQMAIDQLDCDLQTGLYASRCAATGPSALTAVGTPAWNTDDGGEWKDMFVRITRGAGAHANSPKRITGNAASVLTIYGAWTTMPDTTSYFEIRRYLPAEPKDDKACRVGTIATLEDEDTITAKDAGGTDIAAWVNPDGHAYTSGDPPRYFFLVTSGRAAGRIFLITGTSSGQLTLEDADLEDGDVRVGDGFAIIGNNATVEGSPALVSLPDNHFGKTGHTQTLPDPASPKDSAENIYSAEYSYACIVSDMKVGDMDDVLRVDVLVFRNYDKTKTPGKNRKPVAWRVAYLDRE